MEELAGLRRIKLEQCVSYATYQSDASQVSWVVFFDTERFPPERPVFQNEQTTQR